MNRLYTLALGLIFLSQIAHSQTTWVDLPNNPNIQGAIEFDLEISENNEMYVAYVIYNQVTAGFDLKIDQFNTTWSTIYTETLSVGSAGAQMISMTHYDTITYILFLNNDSNLSHTLGSINNGTYAFLNSYNNLLDHYAPYTLQGGTDTGQLYLACKAQNGTPEGKKLNFASNSWTPLTSFTGTGDNVTIYNTTDSVYFGFTKYVGPDDEIFIYAGPKANPPMTPANLLFGNSLRYFNTTTSLTDVVQSNQEFFITGPGHGKTYVLAKDNGIPVSIPIDASGYGTGVVPNFNFSNNTDLTNAKNGGFFATQNSNANNEIAVFGKDPFSNSFSQLGPAVNTTNASGNIRIAAPHKPSHKVVGYQDNNSNPVQISFKGNNTAPTLVSNVHIANLCGSSTSQLFSNLTFYDNDYDTVIMSFISSSNSALINASSVVATPYMLNGTTYMSIQATHDASSISVPTQVTLTFNFSDGLDLILLQKTFTVRPETPLNFVLPTEFCSNVGVVDLNDYVDIPNGVFKEMASGNIIPTRFIPNATFTSAGTYPVTYDIPTGCYAAVSSPFVLYDAPTATITNINDATSCAGTDGTVSASIAPGTATNYKFQWNNGDTTNLSLIGLAPNLYVLEVLDDNGCEAKVFGQVNIQNVVVTSTIDSVSCFGGSNGKVVITNVTSLTAPLTYLWTNGSTNTTANNLSAGTYSVTIQDALGCVINKDFVVNQRTPINIAGSTTEATCGLSDGAITISTVTGGAGNYNYTWSSGPTTQNLSSIGLGLYTLTVTDGSSCTKTKTFALNEVGGPAVVGTVLSAGCLAATGSIDISASSTTAGVFTYLWSNTAVTEDLTSIDAGDYNVIVTDDNNCRSITPFNVGVKPPLKNNICITTVDTLTTTNLVVWEPLTTTGIDYYKIYRESAISNQFIWIDSVQSSDLSVFNDVVASPAVASWRYRISAVNECGIEGPLSNPHKTIHLTREDMGSNTFKIWWNFYEGTTYPSFIISRYTDLTGWEQIGTLPATLRSFIDSPPSTSGLDYHVGFDLPAPCTAIGRGEDFHYCRSNRAKGVFNPGTGTGHSNNSLVEIANQDVRINYYPNPVDETLFIEMDSQLGDDYVVFNIMGESVGKGTINPGSNEISTRDLPSGMYYIRLAKNSDILLKILKK